jgi:hypothetical protein
MRVVPNIARLAAQIPAFARERVTLIVERNLEEWETLTCRPLTSSTGERPAPPDLGLTEGSGRDFREIRDCVYGGAQLAEQAETI